MKRLVLIGFGGLGREVLDYVSESIEQPRKYNGRRLPSAIAFIDDADRSVLQTSEDLIDAGTLDQFQPTKADQLLVAVGKPQVRRKLWHRFANRYGQFINFVHSTAVVSGSASIGRGTIIGPMAVVNAGAQIGDNVLINCYASVGHGAMVGKHSVLSPYATVLGDASVGSECLLATRATVFPHVKVGDRCTIDAHSFAKMDVPDDHIVRCQTEYQVIRNRLSQSERKL